MKIYFQALKKVFYLCLCIFVWGIKMFCSVLPAVLVPGVPGFCAGDVFRLVVLEAEDILLPPSLSRSYAGPREGGFFWVRDFIIGPQAS